MNAVRIESKMGVVQEITAYLVLTEKWDVITATMVVKKTLSDYDLGLDIIFENETGFFNGEDSAVLKLKSFCLPASRDGSDVRRWRRDFLRLIDGTIRQLAKSAVVKDVNGHIDFLTRKE